ncbi:MAG TPA: LysR family transcriptional regulator, partial [Candidatus Bathyarchaeota archaeon]|nr:LysR family transcriptional regulator [Candidatus Bathyarchaeota archaeon]
ELLRAVDEVGSIMGACRRLKLSYRKAMSYLRKMEERLGRKMVRTRKGGKGGGGAELTDDCRELLNAYGALKKAIQEALEKAAPSVLGALWVART